MFISKVPVAAALLILGSCVTALPTNVVRDTLSNTISTAADQSDNSIITGRGNGNSNNRVNPSGSIVPRENTAGAS
jgi:hypothetical protein